MENRFEIKKIFPVKPAEIFNGWLDSDIHAKMTGGSAKISMKENDHFSAWDGYISGKTINLEKDREIIQSWRTTDFKDNDKDSHLKIELVAIDGGTELTLIHSNIPDGQPDYKQQGCPVNEKEKALTA